MIYELSHPLSTDPKLQAGLHECLRARRGTHLARGADHRIIGMHLTLFRPASEDPDLIRGKAMETAMTQERIQQLDQLSHKIADGLMAVAMCTQELCATIRAEIDAIGSAGARRPAAAPASKFAHEFSRPLIDYSTLSVSWDGKTCDLGNTILLRLMERLSRRPNQYVTFSQLLCDVWKGDARSDQTIRSAVRHLRQRLRVAGMDDLAVAIQGQGGRYGLILEALS